MAKATVLKCDGCDVWDSEETPVRNVAVAGPRYDLCGGCRAGLMINCGTDAVLAYKYQAMVDERVGVRGNMPALSAVEKWTPRAEPGSAGSPDDGQHPEEMPDGLEEVIHEASLAEVVPLSASVDEIEPEAENEPVTAPRRRASAKK